MSVCACDRLLLALALFSSWFAQPQPPLTLIGRYLSTVAWDPVNATKYEDQSNDCEVNGVCNGFDEASLVVVPNPVRVGFGAPGETVVAIMRSGGPLFRAFSLDGGNSWSTAREIAPHGVSPQAIVMQPSNIIAVVRHHPTGI